MNGPFRTGRVFPRLVEPDPIVVPLRRRGPPQKLTDAQLSADFQEGLSDEQIAAKHKCATATVYLKRTKLGLLRRRKRILTPGATKSRFEPKIVHKHATLPPVDHPALSEGRTIFPTTVTEVEGVDRLLISGENHWKIGSKISKGPLRGFPIYTLTLEERATCPDSCRHWRSCYGNHMHLARRLRHGPAFEDRLGHELAIMQYRHPKGFAVRLHVLGDFYSVEYVSLWESFIQKFPALFVFGFTARHDVASDPIAKRLREMTEAHWPRFGIRYSNAPLDECATISVEHPRQIPADTILCPQQVGKTRSCGTCGLCWHTKRRIAFLQH